MQLINRDASVLTGRRNLEPLRTFPAFPVFFGAVDTPEREDLVAPMQWAICPETGVIQLTKLVPLDILYQTQHVDGYGSVWRAFYDAFAAYVAASDISAVLEIGGGAGRLARATLVKRPMRWTIVEPNPLIESGDAVQVIRGWFDRSIVPAGTDAIVLSQVMEHVYDPHGFVADVAAALQPGQHFVFSYPHLSSWFARKHTNALNFEHTMLLTDEHLDALLPCHGLEVVDKTIYGDYSVFYRCRKSAVPLVAPPMPNLYPQHCAMFQSFCDHHETMVAALNRQMETSTDTFYLFGAHIFATFLFAFGLRKDRIAGILDNSPLKQGRRLYGTPFTVESPEVLRGRRDVSVILRAGSYDDEIRDGIVAINPSVRFP